MDCARFAKFSKDCGLIDKKITTTEIDIVFNKFKVKGARKLNYDIFNKCLQYIAEKKFSDMDSQVAYRSLVDLVCKKSSVPALNSTLPETGGVYDKLTDTALYTGAHKARFDEDGKGNGLGLRSNLPEQGMAGTPLHGMAAATVSKSSGQLTKSSNEKITKTSTEKLAVFDRLTNTEGYTGSHKARFNANGTGKGLAGRDSPSKSGNSGAYHGGDVKDLSQILRS
jgi:hypothetical protein